MARTRARLRCVLTGLALCSGGCRTVEFYSQGITGQLEVMRRRQPIEKVAATTFDAALRERLELTRRVLNFAERELHLPSGGSYEQYADLGRKHLVWVVYAAPPLSMEPRSWWYPVVGRQEYRGWFREDLARTEAERLEADGLEVWIEGVDAFSTLGWFRDPVLNTFVGREEVFYVELIFHELVHRKHYVRGDTGFNEGLAEAVAREGVRRWFRHTGRPQLAVKYDALLGKVSQAREAIEATSDSLEQLYASDLSDSAKLKAKQREIAALKRRLRALRAEWGSGLTSWIEEPVNNARLNSFTTYETEVPRFAELLEACDGDFTRFWEEVAEVAPRHRAGER